MAKLLLATYAILATVLAVPAPQNRIDPSLSWRVVGGEDAADGEYPYQISMRMYGSHGCGGSIVDETTILTAAHCVVGQNPAAITVVVGTNKLNAGGETYKVESLIPNKDYDSIRTLNDIALIKLAEPIKYTDLVQAINLETNDVPGDVDAVLSGWGRTSYPGVLPNNLQHVNLKTISVSDCKEKQPFNVVVEQQICTLTKAGEGACHGDSGGPLVSDGRQIGIVSWGMPCAVGFPDVFTRVSSYADWINSNK